VLFRSVPEEAVIPALDVKTIYQAPLFYHSQGLDTQVLKALGITDAPAPDLSQWEDIVAKIGAPKREVVIAIVGKYIKLKDAYKSLIEALDHAGIEQGVKVVLRWINARSFTADNAEEKLKDVHGILVPGGFGETGIEGMIEAVTFAREHRIPYLGICLGMQVAVIEVARNLAHIKAASSTEFGECESPVVGLMTEWMKGDDKETRSLQTDLGGTMRLGAYDCHIVPGSLAEAIYKAKSITERHRHRYEVNINYKPQLEKAGLRFSGMSPDGQLPEIAELPGHPWFVGVQFHPELKSRPFATHPLFVAFVEASLKKADHKNEEEAA
jgi:CTP synthase